MSSGGLHISISAEEIFSVGGLEITNSIFTSLIISFIILSLAFALRFKLSANLSKPGKFQNFIEWMVDSFYSLVYGVTNDHAKSRIFTPIIMSFFLFILLNNWFGLLPGVGTITLEKNKVAETKTVHNLDETSMLSTDKNIVYASEEIKDQAQAEVVNDHDSSSDVGLDQEHNELSKTEENHDVVTTNHSSTQVKKVPLFRPGTADLNTTLALAMFSVLATQIIGFGYQKFSYFKKFLNFSSPIMFFVGVLETISEFAKIISFAFRLFGNIFAGEVLLVVIASLLPIILPMPFYGLEIFVGFIQALVFSLLTLVFFNMATTGHDDH